MYKLTLLCIGLLIIQNCWATEFKVLSFNTMCDFCSSDEYDDFELRQKAIKEIVEQTQAELISLQEIRTAGQVQFLFSDLKHYHLFYWDSFLLTYPDPALAINTKRFKVLSNGYFWLGPQEGDFSFGWKPALPRQTQWVKLWDKKTKLKFYFIGSHFDNRKKNLLGSAQMVQDFIKEKDIPVIFAADTNCTPDFKGYRILKGKNLLNSFEQSPAQARNSLNDKKHKDLCYHRKGDSFPMCRVDHILFSQNSPWKVKDWTILLKKNSQAKNFASDHRPIMATFIYPSAQ